MAQYAYKCGHNELNYANAPIIKKTISHLLFYANIRANCREAHLRVRVEHVRGGVVECKRYKFWFEVMCLIVQPELGCPPTHWMKFTPLLATSPSLERHHSEVSLLLNSFNSWQLVTAFDIFIFISMFHSLALCTFRLILYSWHVSRITGSAFRLQSRGTVQIYRTFSLYRLIHC